METRIPAFQTALLSMDRVQCRGILAQAIAEYGRMQALEGILVPAMERIGEGWEHGHLALAQVYMSGRICEDLVDGLCPPPVLSDQPGPLIGLGVFLDRHALGKRIVSSALKSAGYRVLDYGEGLDVDELAARARADRVPLLMVSVLMLHSAMRLRELKQALGDGPEAPRLVAGGAPFRFDPTLGAELGLDAYGVTGLDAIKLARRFLGEPCLT